MKQNPLTKAYRNALPKAMRSLINPYDAPGGYLEARFSTAQPGRDTMTMFRWVWNDSHDKLKLIPMLDNLLPEMGDCYHAFCDAINAFYIEFDSNHKARKVMR